MEDLDGNDIKKKISEIVSKFDSIHESDNYVDIVFEMVIKLKEMNLERTENDLIVACIELASTTPNESGYGNSNLLSFSDKRELRKLNNDFKETSRIRLYTQIEDLLNLPMRNRYPTLEIEIYESVSRGAHALFDTGSDALLLQEFVNKYAKQIAEVGESGLNYINAVAILSLNEKYSVLEALQMTFYPHGIPVLREYLRKTGPRFDGTSPEEVFDDEEYDRLMLENEEFNIALIEDTQAYELLKNKIEEFENSN